jgi:hypothetical protein
VLPFHYIGKLGRRQRIIRKGLRWERGCRNQRKITAQGTEGCINPSTAVGEKHMVPRRN